MTGCNVIEMGVMACSGEFLCSIQMATLIGIIAFSDGKHSEQQFIFIFKELN